MELDGIRKARKAAKITQEDLAEMVGLNRATISKYESGAIAPTLEQLGKIARALNTTVLEMIGTDWNGMDMSDAFEPENTPQKKTLDQQLSGIDFALSGEIHDLTDAEKQDILDYIRFKKSQRGGDKK